MNVAMKRLLASSVMAAMLASVPAFAEEAEAYRETSLGLYVTASEAWELMQEIERAVLIDVRDPIEIKFTGFAEPTDIHVPWVLADRENFDEEAKTWPMVKNADFEGVRAVDGWRNSGLPWSYEIDPDIAWRPAE